MFLTTNNPEALPDRLVRSGRIDVRAEFGLATHKQIRGLFELYYGSGHQVAEEEIIALCPEKTLSCSDIQGVFTLNKSDPRGAISELKKRLEQQQ